MTQDRPHVMSWSSSLLFNPGDGTCTTAASGERRDDSFAAPPLVATRLLLAVLRVQVQSASRKWMGRLKKAMNGTGNPKSNRR